MLKVAAVVLMVLFDQITKLLAVSKLAPIRTYRFIPDVLHLTYVENTGAAFSMLQGRTLFLIVLPLAVCAVMVYVLASGKIKNNIGRWSLVMILGGAVGNLIDRIFRGAVVDFFEIRLFKFAVFNVADIFVTVGAVLLFVYIIFFSEEKDLEKGNGKKTDPGE